MGIMNKLKNYNYYDAFSRLVGCFLFVSIISILRCSGIYHSKDMGINIPIMICLIFLFFFIFSIIYEYVSSNIVDSYLLFFSGLIYSILCLIYSNNFFISIGFSIMMIFIIIYLFKDDKLRIKKIHLNTKSTIILISIFVFLYALFGIIVSVYKYKMFYNSTYDIGIFGQMFTYMKTNFIPYTTCERDYLLSHFAVHFSPILYVLLPFYAVFPSAATLDVLQVLVVGSGVIPLYLICKNHNLSNKLIVLISFVFCFFPAITGGSMYSFHENMFLVPLLLWLIYSYEKKSKLFFIPLILTLFIKEDAFVYTTIISLYFLVDKAAYKKGSIGIVVSLVYFAIVSSLMEKYGLGTMNYRYENYMTSDSLLSVFSTIFTNPGYLFNEVFNQDKLIFMLQMLLPVLFIPFFSKNLKQLILVIPLLLINLMPDYVYQYNINFQYVYGSSVCLIYLVVLNINNVKEKDILLPSMMTTCFLLFFGIMIGHGRYSTMYYENKDKYVLVQEELDKLDRSKSVVSSTCYLPHLVDFKELHDYDYPYASEYKADYVVYDARFGDNPMWKIYYQNCINRGYEEIVYIEGYLIILEK